MCVYEQQKWKLDEIPVYSIKLVKRGLLTISDNRIQYQKIPPTYIYPRSVYSPEIYQLVRKF